MSTDVAAVLKTANSLTREQRADLAHKLLLSLDESSTVDQTDIDAAWQAELERRVDGILSGETELVSGKESRARVRALLAELHE